MGINPDQNMPSHNAIFNRILNMNELPNINSIVNITNAISVKYETPFGAHNLSAVEGDINVGPNENTLPFTPMNTEEQIDIDTEEVVYADSKNVITRNWVWRQGNKTKVSENDTEILIPIDTIDRSEEEIEEIAKYTLAVFKHFFENPTATFGIVSSEQRSLDINKLEPLQTEHRFSFKGHEIRRDSRVIDKLLKKSVEDILPSKEKLEKLLKSGRRLKVYQGFDPTGDTLHVGHLVNMRKLEYFRLLGHEVHMLIGDFTARIGDPDKKSARKQLTEEEVKANLREYVSQAKAILDVDNEWNPVKIVYNNDWLGELKFSDVIELASEFTVQQMLKRDLFRRRIESEIPLYVHEFFYPMMQGWDSVHMQIDVEVGGNDQLFNMLAGRQLVASHLNKEKFVIAGKLLETPDGDKMGKTTGNMIKLNDSSEDIYGKVMAMPDSMIEIGFELLTDADMDKVRKIRDKLQDDSNNPMDIKKELAFTVTEELKGEDEAKKAAKHFESVFQEQDYSSEESIEVHSIGEDSIDILELIANRLELRDSKSATRRLIKQGAVKLDGEKVEDWDKEIILKDDPTSLKVGKKVVKIKR
jgi:tyrosyl-tRNA synthetase